MPLIALALSGSGCNVVGPQHDSSSKSASVGTCEANLQELQSVCTEACSIDGQTNSYYGGRCGQLGTQLSIGDFIFGKDDGSEVDQASLVAGSVRFSQKTGASPDALDGTNRAYELFDHAKALNLKMGYAGCFGQGQ